MTHFESSLYSSVNPVSLFGSAANPALMKMVSSLNIRCNFFRFICFLLQYITFFLTMCTFYFLCMQIGNLTFAVPDINWMGNIFHLK